MPEGEGLTRARRARRRILGATAVAILAVAAVAWLAPSVLDAVIRPLNPPFPADYLAVAGPVRASIHFEADGTVNAVNLPVWSETGCSDPERVSGSGQWFRDARTGQLWIEVNGERVSWGPDVWWGDYNWDKILIAHCAVVGTESQTLFAPSHD